ncbi:MAG TPA: DUF998 domain-containing protein [Streptosporangiaceae bacterium]
MSQPSHRDPRVLSYLTMRKAVGYLGILLPFVLATGNWLFFAGALQRSVSDYFYTGMRGVLVGGLCIIGAFLLAYRGDDKWENLFTTGAGIGAVGVALFPSPPSHPTFGTAIIGYLHYASGSMLFISLTVIALWLFRKTGADPVRTRLKQLRSRIYLVCGIVMVTALALAGIASLPVAAGLGHLDPVFWLESTAIAAFSISWLVKGQAILRDRRPLPGGPFLRT